MATRAPVIRVPAATPQEAVLTLLGSLDRAATEHLIECALAKLDAADGDPDVELNGDELDGEASEDDFWPHRQHAIANGPGCPISDPGGGCPVDEGEPMLGMPEAGSGYWGGGGMGSGNPADDEGEDDGLAARVPHRDRIRRTRCDRLPLDRYQLRGDAQ